MPPRRAGKKASSTAATTASKKRSRDKETTDADEPGDRPEPEEKSDETTTPAATASSSSSSSDASAAPAKKKKKKANAVAAGYKRRKKAPPKEKAAVIAAPLPSLSIVGKSKKDVFLEGDMGPSYRKYTIEVAPSAKSSCSKCNKHISLGALRAKIFFWGADHPYSYNMHVHCMHSLPEYHFPTSLTTHPQRIEGFSKLNDEQKAWVLQLFEQVQWDD